MKVLELRIDTLQKENTDTVYGNIDAKCMTDMLKDETLRKRKPGHFESTKTAGFTACGLSCPKVSHLAARGLL